MLWFQTETNKIFGFETLRKTFYPLPDVNTFYQRWTYIEEIKKLIEEFEFDAKLLTQSM